MPTQKHSQKNTEDRMIATLQDLQDFAEFKEKVLPVLRKAIQSGLPTKDILEIAKSHAVARLATIACIEPDSAKALQAIDKVLQRTDGPVVQKTEETHKFDDLTDEQLNSIVMSKLRKQHKSKEDPAEPIQNQ